jgi:hypothetical protein
MLATRCDIRGDILDSESEHDFCISKTKKKQYTFMQLMASPPIPIQILKVRELPSVSLS